MTNDDIGFLHAGVRIMGQEYETTKDYNFKDYNSKLRYNEKLFTF